MTMYAYNPDTGSPKLPIDTMRDCANAITAMSSAGFRGNKVRIPRADKAGVISAIRKRINEIVSDDAKKQRLLERLNAVKSVDEKALSLDDQSMMVRRAFGELMDNARENAMMESNMPMAAGQMDKPDYYWLMDVYTDTAIACDDMGMCWQLGYSITSDGIEFDPVDQWQKVEKEWVAAKNLDPLIFFGGEVKALGDGVVEGYLVQYTTENDPDLTGEFFDAKSDLDLQNGDRLSVYFEHGKELELKARKIGDGHVEMLEPGAFFKAKLEERDEYEAYVYKLAEMGKLGWSTGPAQHLIRKSRAGKAIHIDKWPVKDATLTVKPAEFRNEAIPLKSIPVIDLKSLISSTPEQQPEATPEAAHAAGSAANVPAVSITDSTVTIVTAADKSPQIEVKSNHKETNTMTDVQVPTVPPVEGGQPNAADTAVKALEKRLSAFEESQLNMSKQFDTLLKHLEKTPAADGSVITNMGGTQDPEIKSFGDFCVAVKRKDVKRIRSIYKALSAEEFDRGIKAVAEDQGATGGYMVPPDFSAQLISAQYQVSPILNMVHTYPVSGPAGDWPTLDIYTAPTAGAGNTALAGGLISTVIAEGGTFTDRNVYFKLINWRVAKAGDILNVSAEISEDAPAIEALLRQVMVTALAARKERGIIRGTGVGEPLGIINAPALISYNPATSNVFAYADSTGMVARMKMLSGEAARVAFLHHISVLPDVAAFQTGSAGTSLVQSISGTDPRNLALWTYRLIASEHLPQADNDNSVILADLGSYGIWQRGAISIDFSTDYAFNTDQITWRYKERYDGRPLAVSTVTLADPQGSYTQSPFVGLLATHS